MVMGMVMVMGMNVLQALPVTDPDNTPHVPDIIRLFGFHFKEGMKMFPVSQRLQQKWNTIAAQKRDWYGLITMGFTDTNAIRGLGCRRCD